MGFVYGSSIFFFSPPLKTDHVPYWNYPQILKVEELYEAYCIQCRLRDGATNMKHAFSLSPSTKASRESLVELYKNFQECTEVGNTTNV